jgi:hypothetical protein
MPLQASREETLVEQRQDYIVDETRLPLRLFKVLKNGGSAVVDMVQETKTNRIFARKTIECS